MKSLLAAGLAAAALTVSFTTPADAAVHRFANCTAMHRVFPHGVGLYGAHDHTSGTPVTNFARRPLVYKANSGLDRDHDHIACESR